VKIAVVAPTEIPALRANTIQVMKMTQAFAELGNTVRLAAPQSRKPNDDERQIQPKRHSPSQTPTPDANRSWEAIARHYGLRVRFPIDWLWSNPQLRRYDFGIRAVRWARQWEADILYTRLPQAAALASILGFPAILELHDIPSGLAGLALAYGFLHGRGARRLAVITQAMAADLVARFGPMVKTSKTVIAPDGVDLERYANLPEPRDARLALNQLRERGSRTHLETERFTAGYTGHLYPGRGAELLVEVASCLPQVNFLIVGGEPQHLTQLQAQVNERNLENFCLTGFVPNSVLPLYQAACDVLLMPYQSKVEASSGGDISRYLSPMKLFEYMACGRPIICSRLPVLQEVLNDQNAMLVPAAEVESWTNSLSALQNQPDTRARLSAQARLDAQKYSWKGRVGRILEGV
jgi:glycosyltransferase involved in cell wall biosynthesis